MITLLALISDTFIMDLWILKITLKNLTISKISL
jgi:hypothetical protein